MINWRGVRAKAARKGWAAERVRTMDSCFRQDLEVLVSEPPREQSVWTHHYYCDTCGSRLEFDVTKPLAHVCPSCDKTYGDAEKNGAWRTLLHNRLMQDVESAAILARIHPEPRDYVEFIRKTLLYYARNYSEYPVHGIWAGKGKVLPQCLDEAVWIIQAGRCLSWGKDQTWFSPSEWEFLRDGLFRPVAELLKPQITKIHNIHVWLNSAVATCAWWMGDADLLDWTIDGEFGWKQQLEKGVNRDGFWWEGSIGYHFYSFRAFASLALTAEDAGRRLWDADKFSKMLLAPLDLACADGKLPAHNDTWKVSLLDCAAMYELGSAVWPEAGLDSALGRIYRDGQAVGGDPGSVRSSNEALLYGLDTLPVADRKAPGSRHFPASGLGVLENERVRICMKAGPHGGGHDHRDKLNIDVLAANGWRSEDLGTSGYGAEITNRWYKQPAAHNIPVLNQEKQSDVDGMIVQFTPDRMIGKVEPQSGAVIDRTIELTANGWNDITNVESPVPAHWDWCFHGSGRLTASLPVISVESAGSQGGFDWLRNVQQALTDEDWKAEWTDGTRTVCVWFKGVPGTSVLIATGDGNPAKEQIGVLVVRRQTASTRFEGRFEIS